MHVIINNKVYGVCLVSLSGIAQGIYPGVWDQVVDRDGARQGTKKGQSTDVEAQHSVTPFVHTAVWNKRRIECTNAGHSTFHHWIVVRDDVVMAIGHE